MNYWSFLDLTVARELCDQRVAKKLKFKNLATQQFLVLLTSKVVGVSQTSPFCRALNITLALSCPSNISASLGFLFSFFIQKGVFLSLLLLYYADVNWEWQRVQGEDGIILVQHWDPLEWWTGGQIMSGNSLPWIIVSMEQVRVLICRPVAHTNKYQLLNLLMGDNFVLHLTIVK